jgi:chromosome segregation ATPase
MFSDEGCFWQSLLLSKVLRMQQDLEDKKNKAIIADLEKEIKDYEAVLEKKDFILQAMEGSLAEAQAEIAKLKNELSSEKKNFEARLEAEVEKSSNLQKSLKDLQEKCLNFGNRCLQRLKQVFNSVGASTEKFSPLVENLPETLEHIEGEVDALDEVIGGHADFCALLASRGTAIAFMKSGCTHEKLSTDPILACHRRI